MNTRNIYFQAALIIATVMFGGACFADPPAASTAAMTSSGEMQKDMASMYRKMADCLDTGTSAHECMLTVMKDCPVVAKTGHCPISEGMGAGQEMGMGQDHDMKMTREHDMK